MRRAWNAAALCLAVGLSTGHAFAEAGRPDTTRIEVRDLPEGSAAIPDTRKAPLRLNASERAPGFYPIRPYDGPQKGRGYDAKLVQVFADKQTAIANTKGGDGTSDQRTCMLTTTPRVEPQEAELDRMFHNGVTLVPYPKVPDVRLVRSERFEATADARGQLVITDAWVDSRTMGSRLIAKSTLPLLRIGRAAGDVDIYAAKDKDVLQIVVVNRFSQFGGMQYVGSDGTTGGQGACGHIRMPLHLERGKQDMVTVQAQVQLGGDPSGPNSLAGAVAAAFARRMNSGEDSAELQLRSIRIGVSSTWTSSDREPVLSMSTGWVGRARTF